MWCLILTTLVYVLGSESRPMEEGPLWPADSSSEEFLLLKSNSPEDSILNNKQRTINNHHQDESTFNLGDYELTFPHGKRALAMIARWGAFSNIGKQRTPIRSSFIDPETNINTQTRGRMVGQPLRWG